MNETREEKTEHSRRFTIGFLPGLVFEDYVYQTSEGVIKAAKAFDVNLLCFHGNSLKAPRYYYAQKNVIYDLVHPDNVDGIIALSGSIGNFIEIDELEQFFEQYRKLPLVSIGVRLDNRHSIMSDNEKGMRYLMHHFIVHHKARRIAFIQGREQNPEAAQRFNVYKDVLEEYQIPFDPLLVAPGNFTRASGKEAVYLLLDKRKMQFDALIGANDYMALSAMEELISRKIRIPGDVIVAGFDNTRVSLSVFPALTTVEQPLFSLGYNALENLVIILSGGKIAEHTTLPARLITRASCGCSEPPDIRELAENHYPAENLDAKTDASKIRTPDEIAQALLHYAENDIPEKLSRKWAALVSVSLSSWIKNPDDACFFISIEQICSQALENGMNLKDMTGIVLDIVNHAMKLGTGELKLSISAFREKIIYSIGPIAARVLLYLKSKAEAKDTAYKKTNLWLVSTKGIEELKKYLIEEFIELGVRTFFICMYDKDDKERKYSTLLISYSRDNTFVTDSALSRFPSRQLIPGGLRNRYPENPESAAAYSLSVFPLFFQEEQLGFFICDNETLDLITLETLSSELSSTLKGAEYIEEIKSYSSGLEEKIRERTAELEQAKVKLEEANEQKTRFFINLAHDTKTPLTLIKNYLEKYVKKAGMDDDLKVIRQNLNLLIGNMTNYLDAEKLRRGEILYNHNQVIDAAECLQNKVVLFREMANNRKITVKTDIDSDVFLKIDPYAFDRVANNIIENAVKYTNQSGSILISLKKNPDDIVFSVADNGIGINREKLEVVFLPYYQLSHKKGSGQGMGMGLSIVRQIVESIHAEIRIESEPGKGTCISIHMQAHTPAKGERIVTDISSPDIQEKMCQERELEEENIFSDRNNIFIIDDNIQMLSFLKSGLKNRYNVSLAKSGKEALKRIGLIPKPDVIISDVMMDEMDGHELFLALKENEEYGDIPVIFLTANTSHDDRIRGLNEGAVDYIYKPFEIDELTAKIESIIRNRMKQAKRNLEILEKSLKDAFRMLYSSKESNKEYFTFTRICDEYGVTSREKEVLRLLFKGLQNKEISTQLKISLRTVNTHIYNIYRKLNVQTRVELVNKFKE